MTSDRVERRPCAREDWDTAGGDENILNKNPAGTRLSVRDSVSPRCSSERNERGVPPAQPNQS